MLRANPWIESMMDNAQVGGSEQLAQDDPNNTMVAAVTRGGNNQQKINATASF